MCKHRSFIEESAERSRRRETSMNTSYRGMCAPVSSNWPAGCLYAQCPHRCNALAATWRTTNILRSSLGAVALTMHIFGCHRTCDLHSSRQRIFDAYACSESPRAPRFQFVEADKKSGILFIARMQAMNEWQHISSLCLRSPCAFATPEYEWCHVCWKPRVDRWKWYVHKWTMRAISALAHSVRAIECRKYRVELNAQRSSDSREQTSIWIDSVSY